MNKKYERIDSNSKCPNCDSPLQLNLKTERTKRAKIQVYCKYFFECTTANSCTYTSRIYTGPSVKADGFNDNEDLRKLARRKAIESSKSQLDDIKQNLATA